ncbi:hypothetical protein PG996_001002 [Apiospora saccharicola]|uniref:Secreted protein n=1 Tax=Apiospora saccharicola TaxID=335842 RepID=A0ABR1WIA9_9PEZI
MPTQQVVNVVLPLLAVVGAHAAVIERAPLAPVATVALYLAPTCETLNPVFQNLCTFDPVTLAQGVCQNIANTCNVHYPASFKASLNKNNGGACQVYVYPNSDCTGRPIESGSLSTTQTGCVGTTYPGKVVTKLPGGLVDGSQVLPFGLQSAKLVCGDSSS